MAKKGIYEIEDNSFHQPGVNYLLVIAVDKYLHCPRLYNCVKDAKDLIQVLTTKYNFDKTYLSTLFDEEAIKSNIYKVFRDLAAKITEKDNLIVYYSGHGEYDRVFRQGYWIPHDGKENAFEGFIPNSEIKTFLNAIKSHHTFLMVDSCFSGSLFMKGDIKSVAKRYERDPSRWGLTSGRNEIVTDGKPGDNSPFAESILYHLRSKSQAISVQELCAFVVEYVQSVPDATQSPIGEPLSIEGHKNGQFVFHIRHDELRDWEKTKQLNTINAFRQFMQAYPNGQFSEEASWSLRILQNKIPAYVKYINDYPSGKYAKEAFQKIKALEESQAWKNAQRLNTASSFIHYLEIYPDGEHSQEARDKLNRIQNLLFEDEVWENAQRENSKTAFEIYLEQYPEGKFARQAKQRVGQFEQIERLQQKRNQDQKAWEKAQSLHNLKGYQEYQTKFPSGKYIKEATQFINSYLRQEQEKLAWKTALEKDTVKTYKQFITKFPGSSNVNTAKEKLKQKKKPQYRKPLIITGIMVSLFALVGFFSWFIQKKVVVTNIPSAVEVPGIIGAVGIYEVTNEQYVEFLNTQKNNPKKIATWINLNQIHTQIEINNGQYRVKKGFNNYPVTNVSYHGAVAYVNWLNNFTDQTFRLPRENEWEILLKGIDKEEDLMTYGWLNMEVKGAAKIGQKKAILQLYDLIGNVREWTLEKKLIGGAWNSLSSQATISYPADPNLQLPSVGFRVIVEKGLN